MDDTVIPLGETREEEETRLKIHTFTSSFECAVKLAQYRHELPIILEREKSPNQFPRTTDQIDWKRGIEER